MMRTSVTAKLLEINVARGKGDKTETIIKAEIDDPSFFDIMRDFQSKNYDFINKISAEVIRQKEANMVSYPRLKSWACSSKPLQGLLTETHPPASLNRPGGDWLRRFCFS